MSKKLVAYFSATGTTAAVAKKIAKITGADLFEIVPAVRYTAADLDWQNERSRSSLEMKNPNARPPIAGTPENAAQYGVVFLGFPIWWYREPSVVDTFLDACGGFAGATLVLFATSGSSDFGNTANGLRDKVGAGTRIVELGVLNNSPSEKSLAARIAGLAL